LAGAYHGFGPSRCFN